MHHEPGYQVPELWLSLLIRKMGTNVFVNILRRSNGIIWRPKVEGMIMKKATLLGLNMANKCYNFTQDSILDSSSKMFQLDIKDSRYHTKSDLSDGVWPGRSSSVISFQAGLVVIVMNHFGLMYL
jgi:hypothetical protein